MTPRLGRVVVIGASGQLGTALASAFSATSEVVATAWRHAQPEHVALDLGDAAATAALLEHYRPDIVVVAGAMCHVDGCEQEPDLCRRINVEGPAAVAEHARRTGARVVFFSTDHVFEGGERAYVETDSVRPLSVYARSKMEAEAAIRGAVPDQHLILRTGWVYGPDPQRRNFILRLVDRLRSGERVEVPSDQWGSPTYTEDLAAATRFLVERGHTGTFHATGPEPIDRVGLARRVCRRFGVDGARVVPTPTAALGQVAQRSLRVLLDTSKLRSTGAPPFRSIDSGLDALAGWSASIAATHQTV